MKKSTDVSFPTQPIPRSQYRELGQKIAAVRYPVRAIGQVQQLSEKVDSFSVPEVREQLQKLLVDFNSYRKVRGDGNCFFRGLAFKYYSNLQKISVKDCFPYLDDVDLTTCKKQSIPKPFWPYYDDAFLKTILKENWKSDLEYIIEGYNHNYNRSFARLLSDYPYLDFIVVLYFRALCLKAFKIYATKELKQFVQGDEETCIQTYGEESEGLVLDTCSRSLNVNIEVFEIRKKEVKLYKYDINKKPTTTVQLIFYENHYDLIEKNRGSDIRAEKSEVRKQKEKEQDYFMEVSEKMIDGKCFQCNTEGPVYEENGLCYKCHAMSMNTLQNFAKDRLIKAKCAQCKYTCPDVSEQFGLCKDCIKYQSRYAEHTQNSKQNKKEDLDPISPTDRLVEAKCTQCREYRRDVSEHFGLCKICIKIQNRYAEMQKEKQNESKQKYYCSLCNQPMPTSGRCERCKTTTSKVSVSNASTEPKIGFCVGCAYREKLDPETLLCSFCIRNQKKYTEIIFQRAKRMTCPECKEQMVGTTRNHVCKKLLKCKTCGKPENSLNSFSQCYRCVDKKKQTEIRPVPVNKYDSQKCSECGAFTITQPLVSGKCPKCIKSKAKGSTDAYDKDRCKACNQVRMYELKNGMCKTCAPGGKSSIVSPAEKDSGETKMGQSTYRFATGEGSKKEKLQNCKGCSRSSNYYTIKDGYCENCKKRMGL